MCVHGPLSNDGDWDFGRDLLSHGYPARLVKAASRGPLLKGALSQSTRKVCLLREAHDLIRPVSAMETPSGRLRRRYFAKRMIRFGLGELTLQ